MRIPYKTERNEAIYKDYLDGKSLASIATKYNITSERVRRILNRIDEMRKNDIPQIRKAGEKLGYPHATIENAITTVRRLNLQDSWMILDREMLLEYSGIGQTIVDIIEAAQELPWNC